MMASCPPFDPTGPFVKGLLAYTDCETANLAEQGYRLIGAGTVFAQALDGLLIVAVALFGYRMLMGETPHLRDGVMQVIKIGFVLALAQHWSSYQPAVYNLATGAPPMLVSQLFGEASRSQSGTQGQLVDRVEAVDAALGLILHPERDTRTSTLPRPPIAGAAVVDPANQAGPELAPETRDTLTSANNTLLLTMVSGAIGLRIAMALLLALGPLFIAGLLFGGTTSLFSGWVRALLGTMLGLVCVPVVMAFELALVEPQVAALNRTFVLGTAFGALPDRLWIITTAFAASLILALLLIIRAAAGLRFERWGRMVSEMIAPGAQSGPIVLPHRDDRPHTPVARDHAQRVADAAVAAERREAPAARHGSRTTVIERGQGSQSWQGASVTASGPAAPSRATGGRTSAAAQRRDGR